MISKLLAFMSVVTSAFAVSEFYVECPTSGTCYGMYISIYISCTLSLCIRNMRETRISILWVRFSEHGDIANYIRVILFNCIYSLTVLHTNRFRW